MHSKLASALPLGLLAAGLLASPEVRAAQASRPAQALSSLKLNVARRAHTATALLDGRVVVIGGENEDGPVGTSEVINLRTGEIQLVSSLLAPRARHSATLMPDGRVLVAGGLNGDEPRTSTELFDPGTGSFAPGPELNLGRAGHSATLLPNSTLLIAGGRADGTAEVLDSSTGRFIVHPARMNGPRSLHGAVLLKNGDVLLAGGIAPEGETLDNAEVFSQPSQSFVPVRAWMYTGRVRPELYVLPDGKVQIIGGDAHGTMEMFDPDGRYFRGFVDLALTAEHLPLSKLQQARTRTAFIDRMMNGGGESLVHGLLPRADYTCTEIPELGLAVIAGGVDDQQHFLGSLTVLRSTSAAVTTDRIDYPPEGRPLIAGSGWGAGETVVISRVEVMTGALTTLAVAADEEGNFVNGDLSPTDHQVGSYILTAEGPRSGRVAQTSYGSGPSWDPAQVNLPPAKVTFYVPFRGEDSGTVTTYDDPFHHETHPLDPEAVIPFPPIDKHWMNETWIDIGAFKWVTDGSLHLDGYIELTLVVDWGCYPGECWRHDDCPCLGSLPSLNATARFVKNYSAAILHKITVNGGNFNFNNIELGTPYFLFDLPGGDGTFSFRAWLGMVGGIQVIARDRAEFAFCKEEAGSADIFLWGGTSGFGQSFAASVTRSSADSEVVDLTGTGVCVQLSAGPGFTGSVGYGSCNPVIELNARPIAAFLEACLNVNEDDRNCSTYNVDIAGGLKGDLTLPIGCGFISLPAINFDQVYIRGILANFQGREFRDLLPPVITAPANVVRSTDPGSCGTTVTFDVDVEDYCSGVRSVSIDPPSGSFFETGTTMVTVTASDLAGDLHPCTMGGDNTSTETFTVTVNDTEPPRFRDPGPGLTLNSVPRDIVRFADPGMCTAVVEFRAPSATDNCSGVTVSTVPPSGSAFPVGTTTVVCTATDASGNLASCSFEVHVIDGQAPQITGASAMPALLDPPDHQLVDVFVDYVVTDNCHSECSLRVVSNEPDSGLGSDDVPNDIEIIDAHHVRLRSERSDLGSGRVYEISIVCVDDSGNVTAETVSVVVPAP